MISAGLSPAWQQILTFDTLQQGEVNRAKEAFWCASGKVINVAIAAAHLQHPATLITAVGGASGEGIRKEIAQWEIQADWITTQQSTRVCTTLLEMNGNTTELVENSGPVEKEVFSEFKTRVAAQTNDAKCLVLTGSLPRNAPAGYFAEILQIHRGKAILDFRTEALLECLPSAPFLVKPNREELTQTVGHSLESQEDLLKAMRWLNEQGAQWAVVSDGARGVWLSSHSEIYQLIPPRMNAVNAIGCGDSLAAGIAVGLEQGLTVVDAVRLGMGAAANNVEMLLPARLDLTRTKELAEKVVVNRL